MRKSNWIIIAILVIASIIYLAFWYLQGFDRIDAPFDLVVTIVWWVVIIAGCIAINWAENKRRRSLRTSFMAPGLIYNTEVGIVKVNEGESYVEALQKVLESLQYGFEKTKVANDKRIHFKYIVRSDRFSNNGIDWTGEVVRVSNPDDIRHFNSRRELTKLIDGQ